MWCAAGIVDVLAVQRQLNTLDAHVEGIAQQHLETVVPSEDDGLEDSAKLGDLVQNIQGH